MPDREILKSALTATPECLPLEKLELLATGQTPSPPHLGQCPRCQAELAMLKSFESSTPLPDEGAAVSWISSHLERQLEQIKKPSRSKGQRPGVGSGAQVSWLTRLFGSSNIRLVAPTAAIVVVAITSAVLLRSPREPELRADAGNQASVFRSDAIVALGPAGDLRTAPLALQWRAFQGATDYKVVVMEVDHSPLWVSETKDTTLEIPASTRARMLVRKPILWQVTAVDAQGKVLATSPTQSFIIQQQRSGSDGSSSR